MARPKGAAGYSSVLYLVSWAPPPRYAWARWTRASRSRYGRSFRRSPTGGPTCFTEPVGAVRDHLRMLSIAEVERLVALGAERVDWDLYPDDPDFIVLADTEGNRFCVIDTQHHA